MKCSVYPLRLADLQLFQSFISLVLQSATVAVGHREMSPPRVRLSRYALCGCARHHADRYCQATLTDSLFVQDFKNRLNESDARRLVLSTKNVTSKPRSKKRNAILKAKSWRYVIQAMVYISARIPHVLHYQSHISLSGLGPVPTQRIIRIPENVCLAYDHAIWHIPLSELILRRECISECSSHFIKPGEMLTLTLYDSCAARR